DRRLCAPQEVCVQDGLFGQCQAGSAQDRPYFQVTSPVLQRLQDVLRHLMGCQWQDGVTQYVISQEMERIPRLRPAALAGARGQGQVGQGQPPASPPLAEPRNRLAAGPGACPGPFWGPAPVPSYGGQPGAGLGGISSRTWPCSPCPGRRTAARTPAGTRLPHGLRLPGDLRDVEEREQPAPLAAQPPPAQTGTAPSRLPSRLVQHIPPQTPASCFPSPRALQGSDPTLCPLADGSLKRLASLLASYGLGLPELSPQQLSSLSALLQLGALCGHPGRGGDGDGVCTPRSHPVSPGSVVGPALTFRVRQNAQNLSLADVASRAEQMKAELEAELGLKIVQTGVGERNEAAAYPHPSRFGDGFHSVLLTFIALACVAGVSIAAAAAFCLRQHARQREKERLAALGPEGAADSTLEYQELCRQHMATKSLFGRAEAPAAAAETSRVSSVSSQFSDAPQHSPSSHSSTPSWCEEPVQSNMDISTGHMILAYMEDHLRNRDRLAKEWQALCAYQAEPSVCSIAQSEANLKKNRNPDYVPYDHVRIKLKAESNPSRSDFINASPIIEHDPRMPAYIATQGPLSHTIADFWQMVWEHGCTVIVMLSPLAEDSVKQCDRYWPDEGSSLYHIYEVNLVSEHIWCEDFLVRSFYLKNVQSQETRTLTQFHFLSWPADSIPATTRPLLDFRRKVNKCYRGRSCPIIVHCSDGAGRTGTYILVDMVLNRMAKGVKEIDIAATLEHIRDQRPGMVQTKDQFEFALTAVAEEVNAILKAAAAVTATRPPLPSRLLLCPPPTPCPLPTASSALPAL
uniref:Protein tyrosine phosphatase receptor type N n=1 Tax=Anas platyrhynchos TaxID=8839 RepID=A0A8B9SL84_ANAPL